MTIFDTILNPLKDIIKGLETPISTVEHLFGEVIEITEDAIKELIKLLEEMKILFP